MSGPITFYFDIASPYAYLASQRIDGIAARHGRTVDWRAILLGPAMKLNGGRPVNATPLRAAYAREDLARLARLWGIAYVEPPQLPIFSLQPSRAFYWAMDTEGPEAARRLVQALFNAHFGRGEDIKEVEQTLDVAEAAGFDREALAEGLRDQRIKDRLREETDASMARGVFGAPWVIVDGRNYWGADRLDILDRVLAEGD
ncbi:MAG: 2-hydroxychromene-2-carboxylate isomerase [Pseudomonadota bacterium]